jgi:proteasome accessory factor B
MPKKVSKKSGRTQPYARPPLARMLHVHELLGENKYPNCSSIAQKLEVSIRTVLRDIDFMRDQLGLPIEYDPQRFGFYYTQQVTHFPTIQVSEGELLALFVAQKALEQYQGTGFEEPLRHAFKKLTEGLKDHVDFQLGDMASTFSFRTIGTPISDLKLFDLLGRSVLKSLEIEFDYRKLQSRLYEKRHIQPYHLSCVDNLWYLFGFDLDRGEIRTFALPRMKNVVISDKVFKRQKNFSPTKILEQSFGIFSGKASHLVKIKFDEFASQLIREKRWHPSQKISLLESGELILEMTLGSLHEVERWILSWKEHAEVIEPHELRESVADSTAKMSRIYTAKHSIKQSV